MIRELFDENLNMMVGDIDLASVGNDVLYTAGLVLVGAGIGAAYIIGSVYLEMKKL